MTIQIQPYQPGQEAGIIAMISTIQREEFNLPITPEQQPDLSAIPTHYQIGNGNFWVAQAGSDVIGTIALRDLGNNEAALGKMFVAQEWRGRDKAVAQKLLVGLLAWAKEKQFAKIYLGTTSRFLAAHRFYEKNGFQEISKGSLPPSFKIMTVDSKFYTCDVASYAALP